MRARRTVALALTGLLAAATLAACSNGDGNDASTTSGSAATVLNIGMPNGPQTENHNPFLGSSAGASLGYRWMIFEPLVMITRRSNPSPVSRPAGDPFIAPDYKDKKHSVDVDGAKKELTDAGYKLEGDTLKDPTGKPVTITSRSSAYRRPATIPTDPSPAGYPAASQPPDPSLTSDDLWPVDHDSSDASPIMSAQGAR